MGNMDHVAWVTMTKDGPVISNLLLNGILDKRGAVPTLQDFLLYRPRQITQTGQSLGIKSVPNLRDLGGYKTSDGGDGGQRTRVPLQPASPRQPGATCRSWPSSRLKNAYDLRTCAEREPRPDELPPDVSYVWLDVLADSPAGRTGDAGEADGGPESGQRSSSAAARRRRDLQESYREFVSLPSAKLEFRKLFLLSGRRGSTAGALPLHDRQGSDRLGCRRLADPARVCRGRRSWRITCEATITSCPCTRRSSTDLSRQAERSEIPLAILGVKKEYLDAAFDEMEKKYGTIEKYFSEGLGIDAERQQAIRELYLGRSRSGNSIRRSCLTASARLVGGLSMPETRHDVR